MEYNEDVLVEIPDSELSKLLDMFSQNWPYTLHAWYYLNNYIDWKNRGYKYVKFYCPNGTWHDGTIITIVDVSNIYFIILMVLECSY